MAKGFVLLGFEPRDHSLKNLKNAPTKYFLLGPVNIARDGLIAVFERGAEFISRPNSV